ncbi:MAG: hypothetical protein Q9222_001051 [Ikaeria aurantiellina]
MASAFVRTYAAMDGTKTPDFRESFDGTITRILDYKLPTFISRTCTFLDMFEANSVAKWGVVSFAVCYGLTAAILYVEATDARLFISEPTNVETRNVGIDSDGQIRKDHIGEHALNGFAIGCRAATFLWVFMMFLAYWTSEFDAFDKLDLLALEGLLFSLLPAFGVLMAVAWSSCRRVTHQKQPDEEKGHDQSNMSCKANSP